MSYATPTPRGIRKPNPDELAELWRLLGENADDTDAAITKVWTSGAGAPSDLDGVNGDWYLDRTNIAIYEKVAGAWVKRADVSGTYSPPSIFISASQLADGVLGTPSRSYADITVAVWLLDAVGNEDVATVVDLGPMRGWATYDIEVWYANPSATTGDVRWRIVYPVFGAGDIISITAAELTQAAPATAGQIAKFVIVAGLTVPTTADPMQGLQIGRRGSNVDDVLANDIALLGLRLVKAS